ncbi:MAG: site-specific DNA-methyltransferase [Anaerolineales bacterium]|jgi:DNA modification methylase
MSRGRSVLLDWPGKGEIEYPAGQLTTRAELYPCGPLPLRTEPNRLILGDNLLVMTALLPQWRNRFRLIYADPPFGTGKEFPRRIGQGEDSRKPEAWQLGDGYQDVWSGLEEYLSWLYPRLVLIRDLLAEDGTLYLHLDWRLVHYARLLLDEIFGRDHFLNEIIWVYHGPSPVRSYFNRKHDTLLAYRKGDQHLFRADRVRIPYNPSTRRTFASSKRAGFGKTPDLDRGKVPEDWWYFPVVARLHAERTGYPTQKPQALLERVLLASSDPGDWVADFFCGSGTTLRVAESLGRKWVGVDLLPQAIRIGLRRMTLAQAEPFLLEEATRAGTDQGARAERLDGILSLATESTPEGIRVGLQDFRPCEPQGFPTSLDYWEADFDYRPPVFRSLAQGPRPWRGATAPTALEHAYASAGEYTVRVQAFSAAGNLAATEFAFSWPGDQVLRPTSGTSRR